MIIFEDTNIEFIAMHKVGNKHREEEVQLSRGELKLGELINSLLLQYFTSSFEKQKEFFNLTHEADIEQNTVFNAVSAIFDNPSSVYNQSIILAQHLYDQSVHPMVKPGEFYVTYLTDCVLEGESVNAVGIFKSEMKDTFLKVKTDDDNFIIDSEDGINISKLDKGCIIFNTEKEAGYVVSVIDNVSKNNDAVYWSDEFLEIKPREDNFYHTQNTMQMYKNFVTERLPKAFEVEQADQADILNKSAKYFKENDVFDMNTFNNEILGQPEVIETFQNYKQQYQDEKQVEISDEFSISDGAVKKQSKFFKHVLKLDKDFHIYIHGNREKIERGFDNEKGMNFYKVFFNEEKS